MRWTGTSFEPLPLNVDGTVIAISASEIIIQRDDTLVAQAFLPVSGEITSQTILIGVNSPVFLLPTGALIFPEADGLAIRKPDGTQLHIDVTLPDNFTFQQMGDGWIEIRGAGPQFALRIVENREQIYRLPDAEPEVNQ